MDSFFGIPKVASAEFLSLFSITTVSFWECLYVVLVRIVRSSDSIFMIALLELFTFFNFLFKVNKSVYIA